MIKPSLPNIPGVGVMTDTLDFVKNLWGSMNVPGVNMPNMAAPTLSVEELDKKISDLKTVEAWLNMNVSMLRSTIQTLEVQRGTIATLKSVGASLANAVKPPSENKEEAAENPAVPNPSLWWNMLQDQFKQAVSTAMSAEALAPKAAAEEKPKKARAPAKPRVKRSVPKA